MLNKQLHFAYLNMSVGFWLCLFNVKNSDLKKKTCNINNESRIKAEQHKVVKLQTRDLSYFPWHKLFW